MRTLTNLILGVCVILMAYLCIDSIMQPIRFGKQKKMRDRATIGRLMDIRTAQIEYKEQNGTYTASFDTLISFVKNGKKALVQKEGDLTDKQLENGMTEQKATDIVNSGNLKKIKKEGLEGFRRDTTFIPLLTTLFAKDYPIDELGTVPYTANKKFDMKSGELKTASGVVVKVFEASVLNDIYLKGLNKQEIINLDENAKKLDKFPGLKVGSITEANNNAGNWE